MLDPTINEIYIKGTPEAINKIWEMIKQSELKIVTDLQIIDFRPQIHNPDVEEEEW